MKSCWQRNCIIDEREALKCDIETDVAIIGAGLSGLLLAYKLQKHGIKTVVLEANRIASGQSGKSSAKITSQHNLIYQKLLKSFCEEEAIQYAQIHQRAIEEYASLVEEEKIDCGFKRTSSTLFTLSNPQAIMEEVKCARLCGIDALFEENLDLPIKAACGITFQNQAVFDPVRFLKFLSEGITIYEHTRVLKAEDHCLFTAQNRIKANKIVFACHFPFVNFPGLYFSKMYQIRSHCILMKNAPVFDRCCLGIDEGALSFRDCEYGLLVGGESYRANEHNAGKKYEQLADQSKALFPQSEYKYGWSAQDCMTLDGVPYIGRFAASFPDWFIATGYNKWGMTSSMAAADIISAMIIENKYIKTIFDPSRFNLASIPALLGNGAEAIKGLVLENLTVPTTALRDLPLGHGGLIQENGRSYGVYKDEKGFIYAVDPRCPHLGCQLQWNPDEKSWDCPCHGSRFDFTGKLLDGPAQKDLTAYRIGF